MLAHSIVRSAASKQRLHVGRLDQQGTAAVTLHIQMNKNSRQNGFRYCNIAREPYCWDMETHRHIDKNKSEHQHSSYHCACIFFELQIRHRSVRERHIVLSFQTQTLRVALHSCSQVATFELSIAALSFAFLQVFCFVCSSCGRDRDRLGG